MVRKPSTGKVQDEASKEYRDWPDCRYVFVVCRSGQRIGKRGHHVKGVR